MEDEKELVTLGEKSLTDSEVLSSEDLEELKALMPELQHALYTRTIWRTEVEARYSVLNDIDHPTPASKFHQSKLEMAVFTENLIHLSFAYRRKLVELEETEDKLRSTQKFERRKLEIDRDEQLWMLEIMRIEAKHRLRELQMWHKIKAELTSGGEKFDLDDKNTDQLIALTKRYCQEFPIAIRSRQDTAANRNIIAHTVTLVAECDRRGITLPEIGKIRKLLRG